MNSSSPSLVAALCLSLSTVTALAQGTDEKSSDPSNAIAVLHATEGNKVAGTVTFKEEADGVRVHAELTGLTPGNHGFHIHEFGDCSAADLTSAGGHFNPTNSPHAGPDASERHEGDMGNIEADASGKVTLDYLDHHISISPAHDKESVIGRSVIIHAKPDDLKSQPSGDAGARIACGVIGIAKTK